MIPSFRSDERGIALAIALFALALIGALVGGTFFVGRLEQQSGQNVLFATQAGEAAEAGLSEAMATVAVPTLEALAVGGPPLDLGTVTLAPGISSSRQVTRLTAGLFLIGARGARQDAAGTTLSARSVGLLVRLDRAADSADSGAVVRLGNRAWVQLY